jgi:RNA polymerase sigma-70 factor (ECF subfamily)
MNLRTPVVPAIRPSRDELDDLLPAFDAAGRAVQPHGPWRPIDPVGRERDREIVRAAIARLPEPYRTIYRLHDGLGMSKDDVVHRLSMPRDDVARLLHRARCALVTLLDPHFREDTDVAARE